MLTRFSASCRGSVTTEPGTTNLFDPSDRPFEVATGRKPSRTSISAGGSGWKAGSAMDCGAACIMGYFLGRPRFLDM
jgi:hypothetical protein